MTAVRRLSRVGVTCVVAILVLSSSSLAEDGYPRGTRQPAMTPLETANQSGFMASDDAFGFPTPPSPVGPEVTEPVQDGRDGHKLAVYYVIPSDLTYEPALFDRLVTASLDIQSWYQCATGGLTWTFDYPEIVRVYYALQTHDYYKANGDWWGSLLPEMEARGYPIWETGTVTALLARGAGWWAGAAQWCSGQCGVVLLGVESFPEFNDPAYSGGECPGGQGVDAWPCTPEGAYAHELGHTVGLLHPIDNPPTAAYAYHSIMQSHWNYPDWAGPTESPWGFLTPERATIQTNPFLTAGIDLRQTHEGCDIVNLPPNGPAPTAQYSFSVTGLDVQFTNLSVGAVRYYWSFGDSTTSNEVNPVHTFDAPNVYTVRLRCSAANAVMAMYQMTVDVRPRGACCNNGGACEISLQDGCASPSVWHGEWTTCGPNPCPQPGVCCTSDGSCAVVLEANCGLSNTWHGEWTNCVPNPCTQPSGACCFPDGLCQIRTLSQCLEQSGIYQGGSVPCEPNPCPQPPAKACCNPTTGDCTLTTEASCLPPSVWHWELANCTPDLCPTSDVPAIADGMDEGFFGGIPNPFATSTTFWYRIARAEYLLLEIFDAGGHKVHSLQVGMTGPGVHSIIWNGRSAGGDPVTSGVFFARLSAGDRSWTRALIRVK